MIKISDKTKKRLNMIGGIISYVILGFAALVMLITIITIIPSNEKENEKFLFGYKFYIVTSDSMAETDFSAGDLICIKKINPDDLHVGDIISYISKSDENYGAVVTHKIREKIEVVEGKYLFVTYGTTTNTDDILVVEEEQIIGKYVWSVVNLGRVFAFLKTVPGYICCIALPLSIVIIRIGFFCIKSYKQVKEEENLDSEDLKNQNEEMKKEIEELKEKYNKEQ